MLNPEFNAEVEAGEAKPQWAEPKITIEPVRATAGDPTISDDGLGDGLFS